MKVYAVIGFCSAETSKIKIKEYFVDKETPKMYVLDSSTELKVHIRKSEIMQTLTNSTYNPMDLGYHTWCFEDQLAEAVASITHTMGAIIEIMVANVNKMHKTFAESSVVETHTGDIVKISTYIKA